MIAVRTLLGIVIAVLSLPACSDDQQQAPGTGGAAGSGGSAGASGGAAGASQECRPAAEPFGTDPQAGHSFPDLSMVACDGSRLTLDSLRCTHSLTLVSIGAGWCEPCKEEAPHLEAVYQSLASSGVGVVQVLFQDAQGQPATTLFCEAWVAQFGLSLPVFIDPPGNSLDYFDAAVTPLNLILAPDGLVLWSAVGVAPADLEGTVRGFLPSR